VDRHTLPRFFSSPLGGVLKLAVGLLVLWYVTSTLDWQVLRSLAQRASALDLVLIAVVAALGHVLGALRFKRLCDPVVKLPLFAHTHQYFVGAYFSLFLPSSMGGDGVRIVLLKGAGASVAEGTSLIATERILGAFSLLVVSTAGALAAPLPRWLKIGLAASVVGAFVSLALLRALSARFTPRWAPLARALATARLALGRDRLASALVLSVAYQAATVFVTVIVDRALDLGVPGTTIFALAPLVWFATLLPISVGGLGVREAAFVLVFAWGGIDRERALLLSLGTYAGLAAISMIGALWFTWDRVRGAAQTRP
jgi:glycosyltransferase 2 family protein